MTDEIIAFKGELWLLSWRESHNNGATVTFQLADVDDLEAFKRMTVRKGKRAGQRLMAALVEIGEDEKPVAQKGGLLSKSASQMCEYPPFQTFLRENYQEIWASFDCTTIQDQCAFVLRAICDVDSRSKLDHNQDAAKLFHELMREYREWNEGRSGLNQEAG